MAEESLEKVDGEEAAPVEEKKPDPRDTEMESMKLSLHQLSSQLDTMTAALSAVARGNQAPVPSPVVEQEVTDEELEQALLSGQGSAQTVRRLLREQEKRLLATHINPLREAGFNSLAGMTAQMTEKEMPYYQKYKAEIDQYVGHLQPELRLNPQAYILAHNAVVGSHLQEVMEEDRATKARQASQEASLEPGMRGVRRSEKGERVTSVEDLGGTEALDALRVIGKTDDEFARKLGYKNWATYMKETEKYA